MSGKLDELVDDWVARPENSARTVLVTIFGDAIQPVADGVWLSQLFELASALDMNERLVRTSVYRLTTEGWLGNERIGRRSRYELTSRARLETVEAAKRIYHVDNPDWTGKWTVVLLDAPGVPNDARTSLREHLGWHGFIPLSRHVIGSPTVSTDRAVELCRLAAPDAKVPVGTFEFSELDAVVATGFFDTTLAIAELTSSYEAFLDFYGQVADAVRETSLSGKPIAFALRTMLVHDLRRIRLGSPDLPLALLPDGWAGSAAFALAADLYRALSTAGAPWLSKVLEVDYPGVVPVRFDD